MKKLMLNTTEQDIDFDGPVLKTRTMKIAQCCGCCRCWLVTPGICSIADDQQIVLHRILEADEITIAADTSLGFLDHHAKKVIDRLLPLATMKLQVKNGQMRHQMRYDHKL